MKEVLEIKRRTNCSEEEKVRKVNIQLERYMFYSHKRQLNMIVNELFSDDISS